MTDKHSLPQPERRTFTPYVMIWALLASLSLAYLAILFMQPGSVSKFMGGSHGVPDEEMRAIARAASEVPYLRETVGQARMDIDELKAELSGQAERDRDLISRIAALEARPQDAARGSDAGASSTSTTARAVPDKRAERQPAKPSARLPQDTKDDPRATAALSGTDDLPVAAGRTVPAAKTAAKKASPPAANDGTDAGLETGSVAGVQPPVTFGPPIVTPAAVVPPKSFGLQVGTAPSVESLRMIWNNLSVIHSNSLGPFQPRYVSGADPAGGTYDLVVGPVASAGEAKRLCKELTLKGTPCKVGDYTGNAF
jgi:hypothetical protein